MYICTYLYLYIYIYIGGLESSALDYKTGLVCRNDLPLRSPALLICLY